MRKLKNILTTGGSGFIGSNFIHYMFNQSDFTGNIVNVDKLTYAGNPENLAEIEKKFTDRYHFEHADIIDQDAIKKIFSKYQIDTIVHFAAESHVDRSIHGPRDFIETNILGTFVLLEVYRENYKDEFHFHHVSTDEVYGSLGDEGQFCEETSYDPRSPYSASKASSDHLVRAYFHTYDLPITISNCSNNYGPYQFPEKLIPVMIMNILEEKPLPVYGDGKNIRDWLYVDDHNSAIWKILQKGRAGETYNIGGDNEWENIKLVEVLCEKIAKINKKESGYYKKLIEYVKDRPGHDRRYAINCEKLKNELGWKQSVDFDRGLDMTIGWYMENSAWIENVRSGGYRKWIEKNYGDREG